MNLWNQFKKHKTSFIAFWILFIITLTAVYAPLISNNKPLVIYTKNSFIYTDYLDSAQGTLNLIIEILKKGDRPQLNQTEWLEKSVVQASLFLSDSHLSKQILSIPITDSIQKKEINALIDLQKKLQEIEKASLTPRLFFPAFKSLNESDLFFMLLIPLFFLLTLIKKKLSFFSHFHLTQLIFFALIASLAFSVLYFSLKKDHFDSYNYKKLALQFDQKEWALFPIIPYGENENRMTEASQPPTFLLSKTNIDQQFHLLGTDTNGRDVLSRMIYGSRVSMSVGFVAVSIYVFLGIIIGSLAGFYGGWTDIFISRMIEIMICFPVFFLILTVMAFLKPSIFNIMVIIGLTGWTGIARLMRGEFFRLKNQEFVLAAQSMGASDFRLIFKHIFPNGVNPILISATFGIAGAILTESALSFLGFGVPQPTASWGDTLNNGRNDIYGTWWLTVFPGTAIFITVTCFNLIGEKLRDLLDPKMKER